MGTWRQWTRQKCRERQREWSGPSQNMYKCRVCDRAFSSVPDICYYSLFSLKHYVTILLPLHFRVKKHKQEAKAKKNSSSFLLLCFAFLLLIFFLANKRNSRSCEFVIHLTDANLKGSSCCIQKDIFWFKAYLYMHYKISDNGNDLKWFLRQKNGFYDNDLIYLINYVVLLCKSMFIGGFFS